MPSLTDDAFDMPLAKRQKRILDQDVRTGPPTVGSKVFSPFRVRETIFEHLTHDFLKVVALFAPVPFDLVTDVP